MTGPTIGIRQHKALCVLRSKPPRRAQKIIERCRVIGVLRNSNCQPVQIDSLQLHVSWPRKKRPFSPLPECDSLFRPKETPHSCSQLKSPLPNAAIEDLLLDFLQISDRYP